MTNGNRHGYSPLRQVGLLTTIPLLLLAAPVVGYFIGRQLDTWFKTAFWIWIFCALGMIAGVLEVIKILKRATAEAEVESHRDDTD